MVPIVIEGQRPPVEIDGSNHTATVPVEGERLGPPEQPVNDNPPADDNTGVLRAALGVAGIAGLAAQLTFYSLNPTSKLLGSPSYAWIVLLARKTALAFLRILLCTDILIQ